MIDSAINDGKTIAGGVEIPWVRGGGLVVRQRCRVWSGENGRAVGRERLAAWGTPFSPLGEITFPYGREDDS